MRQIAVILILSLPSVPSKAETAAGFQLFYASQATQTNPAYLGPSIPRGEQFFQSRHGGEWSCASCHGVMPTMQGKHQVTGKSIQPLAPAINPARFSSASKVEKWFKRNCGDVLNRDCTAAERADVIAYLNSLH